MKNTKSAKIIPIKDTFKESWSLFRRNWKFLSKCFFAVILVQIGMSLLQKVFGDLADSKNASWLISLYANLSVFALSLIIFYVSAVTEIGMVRVLLGVLRIKKGLTWKSIFQRITIKYALKYFLLEIIYLVVVTLGLLLFIVPGIYFAIKYSFSTYLYIDGGLGIKASLQKSAVMTEGIKTQLFLLGLAALGINILGLLALGFGLLITIPATMFSSYIVYNKLLQKKS